MIDDKIRNYLYYIVIGILSFVSLVFLPMVGTEVGMSFVIPTTVSGWIVYIMSQLIVAIINVLLFHSFILQSKINVRDNESYKQALKILRASKEKDYRPRSEREVNRREYGQKGTTIFLSSIMSVFALGQAILTYDYMKLLTYLFTIVMGIIFGVLEMKKYEEYYTGEYLDYALMIEKEANERAKEVTKNDFN